MAKSALITGITGQDGSYLAEQLLDKGYKVHGMVRRLSTPNLTNIEAIKDKVNLIDGDLSDQVSLNHVVRESQPDEVYNLAAQSFVATSFQQPLVTSDVSGVGVVRMLEAVRMEAPDARFYQASTSELYGEVREIPQSENTPFHPRSPYGFAKMMGYWAVVNYRESYGMHASNGILFNHESPRRGIEFVTRKITSTMAKMVAGDVDCMELGNMDAKRDWGFAPEYVDGMWRMLQQDDGDDYVLATGETHTIRSFVENASQEAGFDIHWEGEGVKEVGIDGNSGKTIVRVNPRFFRPAEVELLMGDPTKAKEELGWSAGTDANELARLMTRADMEVFA